MSLNFLIIELGNASYLPLTDTIQTDTVTKQPISLDEVVVFFSRNKHTIHNLSAPVQVVDQAAISKNEMGDLSSVLTSVSGVQMQSGTFQTNRIVIRGIGSRSPYSTNRTRAYFDDIPLTSGDGTTIVDDIELSFIDKVEITKGSYSAWHGGGMGGSIRFVSFAEPNKVFDAEANAIAGSFGFQKYTGNVKTKYPLGSLNVGLAHHSGNGFRENSKFKRNSLLITGKNGKKHKFNYIFSINDVHSNTPSSIDYITFKNSPSKAAPNWLNAAGFKNYIHYLGGMKSENSLGKNLYNTAIFSGSILDQYELRPFNILDDNSIAVTLQENIQLKHRFFTASLGVDWMHEKYSWKILENTSLNKKQHTSETRKQLNTYFNFETNPLTALVFSLHGNLNSTHYDIEDLFLNDSVNYSGMYFNKLVFSPKIGLTYRYNSSITIYASAGHGFSNPTVEESLTSDGFFNSRLKPEQGWTVEIGSRTIAYKQKFWMDFSLYTISLNNLLVTKRLSEEVFYGENAGKCSLHGAEIQFTYKPATFFQTVVSSAKSMNKFNEFVSNNIDFKGKDLPGIPNFQANIDLQTTYRQFQLNTMVSYTGSQFMDDANSVEASDWKTVSLRLSYTLRLSKIYQFTVVSTVRNLFNEHYASMVLVNAPSFSGSMPRYYYPGMPRNFLFAIEMNLF